MKKILPIFLAVAMVFSLFALTACGSEEESSSSASTETITIQALNASAEEGDITVPYDPQRIAILDFAALDIIDNLGLGDRVVGCASTTLDYLMKYTEDENVELLGTIKEADLEAVMACEPDVIFIGGRLSASYDALNEIAPVVYLATDSELGVYESTLKNAKTIASIFGKEDEITEKFSGFDERIAALKEIADGKTAVIGMSTGGTFNVLGNNGRCALIVNEIGFENLCKDTATGNRGGGQGGGGQGGGHGQGSGEGGSEGNSSRGENTSSETTTENPHGSESSFELLVSLNPDYIFVMDRDAAIGTEGAQLAKDIMENELIKGTDAYKNGNLVYLEHPAVWYTAEGGVTALSTMLDDLEAALLD